MNIKREYFKLSLFNEQVKVQLQLVEKNKLLSRKLIGHRKAFKGITQSIRNDKASIYKQFVYLEHVIEDEFEYIIWKEDGSKEESKRSLSED
jgi:hypothetical protein